MVRRPRVSEKEDLGCQWGFPGRGGDTYHHRGKMDMDSMYRATVRFTTVSDVLKWRVISGSAAAECQSGVNRSALFTCGKRCRTPWERRRRPWQRRQ